MISGTGALPVSFTIESEQQVSATLGSNQLQMGIIAGLIGLALVCIYSLFQYRWLGLVTIASLVVAVVRGSDLTGPVLWTGGLFAARAVLGALSETVAARVGATVATGLREQLLAAWSRRPTDQRDVTDEAGESPFVRGRSRALTLATQGTSAVEPYVAKYLPALVSAAVVPALAIAGIAYGITGSGLLALAIVAISIPLPWAAVLIANDRPARKAEEPRRYGPQEHRHSLFPTAERRAIDPAPPPQPHTPPEGSAGPS